MVVVVGEAVVGAAVGAAVGVAVGAAGAVAGKLISDFVDIKLKPLFSFF